MSQPSFKKVGGELGFGPAKSVIVVSQLVLTRSSLLGSMGWESTEMQLC